MAGSALEQLAAQLRGVLESLDAATAVVGVARDSFGEARDIVVEATYGTEDAELVEGIEGVAHAVLDLERERPTRSGCESAFARCSAVSQCWQPERQLRQLGSGRGEVRDVDA